MSLLCSWIDPCQLLYAPTDTFMFFMVTWFSQKLIKKMNIFLLIFLVFLPLCSTASHIYYMGFSLRHNVCMGREEQFFYYFLDIFMDLFWQGSWYKKIIESLKMFNILRLEQFHPVRLVNWFAFCLFAFFVPFVYIRIFYWRWNNKPVGISELDRIFRKKRNFVSMWFNMSIWFFELIGVVIMVSW